MSSEAQKIIDDSFNLLIKNYKPQPIVLDHGKGSYIWDTDGKKYLDFSIGYAVASLGHASPTMLKAINDQASKLMICQASYATESKLKCAQLLIENSCFDLVYFSNSGTESVEASLKCARKWAYDNKGKDCNEIIAFNGSFHGRTYGSGSVTYKRKEQPYFGPYVEGVHFADYNDLESVKALISDKTAAIILEPVQGEGGLVPADPKFLMGVRKLCDEHNIALIFDEVQAGMGRLGTFMAYEAFKCCPDCVEDGGDIKSDKAVVIEPDIAAFAKGMGGGFPVGCMMAKKKFGEVMGPGTHGTTYGGNPLACAVAHAVMSEILSDGFLEHTKKVSDFLMNGLKKIQRESNKITDIRGIGLMIGMNTTVEIGKMVSGVQKRGLLATQAGVDTLRILPPLNITEAEAQEALDIIEKTLQEEE